MQSSGHTLEDIAQHYSAATDALYEIGRIYYTLGKSTDAQRLLQGSLQLFEASEAKPQHRLKLLLLYTQVLLVDLLLARGNKNTDLLFSTILNARQIADASQIQQNIADSLSLLGQVHYFTTVVSGALVDSPQSGKYDEALVCQQQALELREMLHDTRGMSESYFQIGVIYERWQQYARSEEYYTKAYQLAEQFGHLFEKTEPVRHFALHALIKGDLDQALTFALQALQLREEAGFTPYLPLDHLLLRDVYEAKDDQAQAQFHTQKASAIASEMGYPALVSSIPGIIGRLTASQNEP